MSHAIVLDANLDIRAAAPLRDTLLAQQDAAVELDAGQVCRLGALCLQILLAACRDWAGRGLSFSILNPSDAFTEALRLFGAQDALAPALPSGA